MTDAAAVQQAHRFALRYLEESGNKIVCGKIDLEHGGILTRGSV
jgi:hypothetical protein